MLSALADSFEIFGTKFDFEAFSSLMPRFDPIRVFEYPFDMRIIAHRGNVSGPQPDLENRPEYIEAAIRLGFDVEVDIWRSNDQLSLGHDRPEFPIDERFLLEWHDKLWIHAKNIQGLTYCLGLSQAPQTLNVFAHQSDEFVVTSGGFVWTSPGKELSVRSVALQFEQMSQVPSGIVGLCTDYASFYDNLINANKLHHSKPRDTLR